MKRILENKGRSGIMEYIITTLKEAKKVAKEDAIVLVAKQDLENPDCNIGFKKKKFGECHNILEEAATIAKVCDDFANQLRVFSDLQVGVPKGDLHTILFRKS
jgi:hypothetical protein